MNGFCPLASGSKGNCLYLGTKNTKILIDAGISTRATRRKLAEIGVSLDQIDAILITHDHGDHIQGLKVMAFDLGIPILANAETAKGIVETFHGECPRFKIFTTGESFQFGDFEIHPFSIPHDTLDPVAFTIHFDLEKIGICADLGMVTAGIRESLRNCTLLYLEANHEVDLVHASSRPIVYKQRVLSRVGHLSNKDCGHLLTEIFHEDLKQVWLAHLSSECNTPIHALNTVSGILNSKGLSLPLAIAYQEEVSKAYHFEEISQNEEASQAEEISQASV